MRITEVIKHDSGYTISTDDHTGFGLDAKWGVEPRVGDLVELDVIQGSLIRGMTLNGRRVFYETDAELEQKRTDQRTKHDQQRQAELPGELERVALLPLVWQQRIARFQKNNSRFNIDHLGYELFVCEQAILIAGAVQTLECLIEFHDADNDRQRAMVPGLDSGHSGNTFGKACVLARVAIEDERWLPFAHGALDTLVGCDEYGCFASEPKEAQEAALRAAGLTLEGGKT